MSNSSSHSDSSALPVTILSEGEVASLLVKMLINQADLNTKSYNTAWIDKGKSLEFDYNLAAVQELAEFNDSYGYSWWSKEPQDLDNCKMEIVDAIHFMMSQSIIACSTIDAAADLMLKGYSMSKAFTGKRTSLQFSKLLMSKLTAEGENNPWTYLFSLTESLGFSVVSLYTRYMGKSVLNAFRQQNFYKQGVFKFGNEGTGKYLKNWDGLRQDNAFLTSWLDSQATPPSVEDIHTWLTDTYAKCLALSAQEMANKSQSASPV